MPVHHRANGQPRFYQLLAPVQLFRLIGRAKGNVVHVSSGNAPDGSIREREINARCR